MDDYYKLAAAYFKEFEPRSSFPGLKSGHWYLSIFLFALFLYFGYEVFFVEMPSGEKPFWQFIALEWAFLLSCGLIAIHRFKETVRATSEQSDIKPIERLSISKRAKLEALLSKPASQFIATAKEIIEFRDLEKACRSKADQEEVWSKIYDPDSKARLLAFFTALLSLVIAFLGKNEGFNLVEALSDDVTLALIRALAQLIVVSFIAIIGARYFLRQLLEFLPWLISTVFPSLHSRQTTLDYLIRDLIQYHRTESPAPAPVAQTPAEAPAPLPNREPGLGTLIAAVCLSLLRQPHSPSENSAASPAKQNKNPQ